MKKWALILGMLLFVTNAQAKEKDYTNCDFIIYSKCINCDSRLSFAVGFDENCLEKCPNRTVNYYGYARWNRVVNCALKECPEEFPYRDDDGSCYEDQEHVPTASNNYPGLFDDVYVDDNKDSYLFSIPADNGVCSEDTPLLHNNECYNCYEAANLSVSEEDCNKCPNRRYIYSQQWKHGECVIPCPEDKPLRRYDGKCYSCDEEKVVPTETWCNFDIDCEVCPNRTLIHDIGGNIPSVPNCPPERPLMDDHGVCYSCDTKQRVDVFMNPDFCQRFCPSQRHLVEYGCLLNGQ